MSDKTPLVLVDGSSYLFRAYHALPPLTTSQGQATGAVKGVINMIRLLIKQYPTSNIACVFDAKGKTFRNDMYSEYKANRPPMPDDLRSQIEPIHAMIRAMGLPLLIIDDVEADDVIGTLAQQAWQQQIPTLISTGDKDMTQLVNEHVTLLNTMTNETLDIEGVKNKFGLPPERIIDYLALMGDKVDNIPGVPGVGPKTAVKWLQEFDSVENLIARADEVKGKVGETLREHLEQLKLSYELATIKLDVKLEFGPHELVHKEPDKSALLALCKHLEFKSWVKELESEGVVASIDTQSQGNTEAASSSAEPVSPAQEVPVDVVYSTITTEAELLGFVANIVPLQPLAIVIETDDAHYKLARIIGISLCNKAGQASYIPVGHDMLGDSSQLDIKIVLERLKPILESQSIYKVGHDLKTISHVLLNYGIRLRGRRFDTMLQSYVLNSVAHKHTLGKLCQYFLELELSPLEELLGKGRNKLSFAQAEIAKAAQWSATCADYCFRLHHTLKQKLAETGHLKDVYRYFEIALVPVLTRMEENGIRVDVDVLGKQSQELAERLQQLERQAYELAGEEFNLGSPMQLQKIFYEKLGYPILGKTDKGQPSTAEPVLAELAESYPLPKLILEQRGLSKLKSTYTDKLPLDIHPVTKRIHSNFQQAVAATGRLSSTDPNLQNIPIRTEEGRRIRQAFIAEPGKVLMAADYSQVELRIMAHLSADPGLVNAFAEGLDVHRATAAEIFGCPLAEVSNDMRRSAKAINFGLIYGMSAFGLAKQIGTGRAEAQEYVERYFLRYPGVRTYMENTRLSASENGYVETLFGRRLYLPDIRASNAVMRKAAERTAINAPMQGTAADIIKQAMIDIDQWLKVAALDAKMVLQVHDELVFEVAEKDLAILMDGVKFRMISAASLSVPLVVDTGHGVNWDEAH
ncbi:MAG: DNA polymerase I [Pseudomonadota bacterium]